MAEPFIQIGEHVLTAGQAAVVRVAVIDFYRQLGDDQFRRDLGEIGDLYRERLDEVLGIIVRTDDATRG